MLKIPQSKLAKRSAAFRYAYFIVTSFQMKTFHAWREEGEPNPFVKKTYRHIVTERIEFLDAFEDVLKPNRTGSRNAI